MYNDSSMAKLIRRLAFLAVLAGLGGYAFVQLRGPRGISALLEKRRQIEEREDRNRTLEQNIRKQRETNHRLESDPSYLGEVIQQKTGMVPKGHENFVTPKENTEKAEADSQP